MNKKDDNKKLFCELFEELGIKYNFLCGNWVTCFSKGEKSFNLVGDGFNINSDASSEICTDKVACYEVLKAANIPAIPHYLLQSPSDIKIDCPLVIKPYRGKRGENVFLCKRKGQAKKAVKKLLEIDPYVCCSPFFDAKYEYRNFFLDGKIIYCYRKNHHKSWQFNLSKGSIPTTIDKKCKIYEDVTALAEKAGKAVNAKFVTVDIMESKIGELKVLEINKSVATKYFREQVDGGYEIAKEIYRKALKSLIK